ncbi:MAG: ATP synthase F1 subunit delta [Pirellulales bacterium]
MAKPDREKPKHENVMDVTEEQIARVYAQAFMGVAAKSPNPTALVDEVESIVTDILERFPQLEHALRSELVAPEEKARLIDRIFQGRSTPEVLNFLKVLSAHGRLGLLRPIARILKKLDAVRRGLTDVEVRVAAPLDDALEREIEDRLRKTLGSEPVLHVVVDPSLIAGMVIRVGDRVYDGSVHTLLEHARRAMIDRATETIEMHADRFLSSSA